MAANRRDRRRLEGGSQAYAHATAGGAATIRQWSFGGGAEHVRTDGFTGTAPATGERVTNDDWRSSTAAVNVELGERADDARARRLPVARQ